MKWLWIICILLVFPLMKWILSGVISKQLRTAASAIEAGDMTAFDSFLKNKKSLSSDVNTMALMLSVAIYHNKIDIVRKLLALHPGSKYQDCAIREKTDLLVVALHQADADVLRLLLESGMQVGKSEESPYLLCYTFAKPKHLEVLKSLGATEILPEQNKPGFTPLHAIMLKYNEHPEQSLAMAEELLTNGADVNALTAGGHTALDMIPFLIPAEERQTAITELLKRHGARTGRSIRVPNPVYTGRVFSATEELPPVDAADLPDGVQVRPVTQALEQELLGSPKEGTFKSYDTADKTALLQHKAYYEITVSGKHGEDPVEVAKRLLQVSKTLLDRPNMVGIQFERHSMTKPCYTELDKEKTDTEDYTLLILFSLQGGYSKQFTYVETDGLEKLGLTEAMIIALGKSAPQQGQLLECASRLILYTLTEHPAWEPGYTTTQEDITYSIRLGKSEKSDKGVFSFVTPAGS